jgi:UMP-CMP kinase
VSIFRAPHYSPIDSSVGVPCSGKSTLCTELARRYNLDHFSIGNEIRELIKPNPTGPAALIKPTLTADEITVYTRSVTENTLAPPNQTPKYVRERIFGVGAQPGDTRVLIDGFPRDVERWPYFKEAVKEYWTPGVGASVIVLHADREVIRQRFEKRGRKGDEFDKRFNEHQEKIGQIVEAMRQDGLTVVELSANEGKDTLIECLCKGPYSFIFPNW